jgi:hypothetical protein
VDDDDDDDDDDNDDDGKCDGEGNAFGFVDGAEEQGSGGAGKEVSRPTGHDI